MYPQSFQQGWLVIRADNRRISYTQSRIFTTCEIADGAVGATR